MPYDNAFYWIYLVQVRQRRFSEEFARSGKSVYVFVAEKLEDRIQKFAREMFEVDLLEPRLGTKQNGELSVSWNQYTSLTTELKQRVVQ